MKINTTGPSKNGELVVDQSSVTTDESGKATVSVHGRTAGSYKLTATLDELGATTSAEKSFSLYADENNGVLSLSMEPGYVTDDGEPFGFIARLTDKFGNPMTGKQNSLRVMKIPGFSR